MSYPPPEGSPPAEGVAPAPSVPASNEQWPALPPPVPPGAPVRPGYWAQPPQPQAPGWPYAGVPPYRDMLPASPHYVAHEPAEIGPDQVPWNYWDVLVAALPFIILLAFNLAAQFLTPTGTKAVTDTPISTRVLALNTIFGIVIYGIILLAIWLRTVHKYRLRWAALGLRRPPALFWALVLPIIVGMYIAAALVSALVVQLFYGGKAENPQVKDLTGGGGFSWIKLVLALITASIAAPIVEELFFRGVLYGWLRTRCGAVLGVLLSAAIFSAVHAIPLILASIFVVGLTLAIVYEKTKSTIATMTLHSLFNTIGVIAVFIDLARK